MAQQYDLAIIGMGSGGGFAAEFAARDLGLRVAAIERDRIGGDCLWAGCVPSKSLVASARVAHTVRTASEFGVRVDEPEIDLEAVWARIKRVQAHIAETDDTADRFEALGVDVFRGTGTVSGYREVTVATAEGDVVLQTTNILICTGSRPTVPAIPGLDEVDYLTSEHLFEIDAPPPSLVVVGGGPISVEIAQSLVRLGVPTTVIEMAPRLVPRDEPELADRLATILRDEGVDLHLATTVTGVRAGGDGVVVETSEGEHTAAGLLVAAGRTANVDGLGLEKFGIPVGPDGVEVDGRNRTLVPNVYVVGDAAKGRPNFTHTAAHDAVVAVRDMFFPGTGNPEHVVPWCTFTEPELAHVGLTAAEARERYGDGNVKVHRRELAHNDRARADGTTEGLILIITSKGRIVGGHALAPSAGELIHELAVAIEFGAKLTDLSRMIHIYPTLSTGIGRLAGESSFRTARKWKALTRFTRLG